MTNHLKNVGIDNAHTVGTVQNASRKPARRRRHLGCALALAVAALVSVGCAEGASTTSPQPPQATMDGSDDPPDAGTGDEQSPVASATPAYQSVGSSAPIRCELATPANAGTTYAITWLADGLPYPESFAGAVGAESDVLPGDTVPPDDIGLAWDWQCTISATDGVAIEVSPEAVATADKPQDCSTLKQALPGTVDGNYFIDVDGRSGPLAPFPAYCDMTTDGGGWTMVLNYVHQANTNPVLDVRRSDLPVMGLGTLGDDESGMESWGHASPAMMAALYAGREFEIRFFGRTSAHGRFMNFKTAECADYFASGDGNCKFIGTAERSLPLPGHSTNIPGFFADEAETNLLYKSNRLDFAMTELPYFLHGTFHWAVRASERRWEVDDFPDNGSNSTIHRIFARPR